MKTALATLSFAVFSAAGTVQALFPGADAPYRVGQFVIENASAADRVFTYGAAHEMSQDEVMVWASRLAHSSGGMTHASLYNPGIPVPDPGRAATLKQALWLAQTVPAGWHATISPDGEIQVTQVN